MKNYQKEKNQMDNTLKETKLDFLTNIFFDQMRHDASIVYPYYCEKEYAQNIATGYLNDHPNFKMPNMINGIYNLTTTFMEKLETYCDKKCDYYEYNKEDEEDEEDF